MSDPLTVPICVPFPPSPVVFDPAWRTETVVALARGIDAGGHYDRMPVLADALEEAGCDSHKVLVHCRLCDEHDPSCWVLKRILHPGPTSARPDADTLVLEALRDAARPPAGTALFREALARPTPVRPVPLWSIVALSGLAGVVCWFAVGERKRPPAGGPLLTPPTFDFRKVQGWIDRPTPPTRTSLP